MIFYWGRGHKFVQGAAQQGSGFPVLTPCDMLVDSHKFPRVGGPRSGDFKTLYATICRLGPVLRANPWSASLRVLDDAIRHMAG
jgi:hypothetical protein